jgi:hypothetical protein
MSISLNSIRRGKIQVKALRALLGMRGHAPSGFNVEVGRCMKRGGYKPSDGGRHDRVFQGHFISCCISAGANVGTAGRNKAGGGGGAARRGRPAAE